MTISRRDLIKKTAQAAVLAPLALAIPSLVISKPKEDITISQLRAITRGIYNDSQDDFVTLDISPDKVEAANLWLSDILRVV